MGETKKEELAIAAVVDPMGGKLLSSGTVDEISIGSS